MLSACTQPFVPGPDVALQSHYKAKPDPRGEVIQPTTAWWANFGDPNLNRLVEEALSQNISLEQARERVKAARYYSRIQTGAYLPQAAVNGSVTRTGGNREPKLTTSGVGISGSWDIDILGSKSTKDREAARIAASKEALYDARLQVIASIANAYMSAQGYGQQLQIAKKSLAVQNNTSEITKAKLEAGSASALDNAQALAQAALTSADIPSLQSAREQYINQIAILLGKEPAALDNLFSKYKPIRRPKVKFSEGIPADLLRNRPDIRLAEENLKLSMADIGVAEADLYPSFTLSGALTTKTTIGVGTNTWNFGPSINLPIFDRGRLYASVKYAKSTARQDYLTYRQTVLDAVKEVENAMVALNADRKRYSRLTTAVEQYRKAEELARQLNEAGNTEFSDVLRAQSDLYSAELQQAQSSLQVALDYVALCQALGGGWAGDEPVVTAAAD